MFRRIAAVVALAVVGLFVLPTLVWASNPPYPAPPVTPAAETWTPVADSVSYTPATALASTGAGFSVGTAVLIGVAVLLVGLGLMFVGKRSRKAGNQ